MATDSQASTAYLWECGPKVQRITAGPFAGYALAIAGRAALEKAIREQVESGEFTAIPCIEGDDGAYALLAGPKGAVLFESDQMAPFKVPKIFAIGSGSRFAMGAMYAGSSAADAVRIASKLDEYTGGKVHTMRVVP